MMDAICRSRILGASFLVVAAVALSCGSEDQRTSSEDGSPESAEATANSISSVSNSSESPSPSESSASGTRTPTSESSSEASSESSSEASSESSSGASSESSSAEIVDPEPEAETQTTLGPEGGVLEMILDSDAGESGEGGSSGSLAAPALEIALPPGAVDEEVEITVAAYSTDVERPGNLRPAGFRPASRVFEFGPAGLTFSEPVTVRLRYQEPGDNLQAWWTEPGSRDVFAPVPDATFEGGVASFEVTHFSLGFVGETCTPQCEGSTCGPDGCDGHCGMCEEGELCVTEDESGLGGVCTASPEPSGSEPSCAEPNACGGCEPLDAEPGSPCGACGSGAWTCSSDNTLACAGDDIDLDTDPVNCGACGNACTGDDICSGGQCVEDEGSCTPNVCGGCVTLPASPGEPCGVCGTGALECDGTDNVACIGGDVQFGSDPNHCGSCGNLSAGDEICIGGECVEDDGSCTPNACGGCEPLDAEPGSPCGTCGAGAWACSGDNTLACAGDDIDLDTDPVNCGACGNACTGDEICSGGECVDDDGSCPPNACGGCETLPVAPGEACGVCSTGSIECDGTDNVACVGGDIQFGSDPNHCGSCGNLCAGDEICIGGECVEDDGSCTPNACGGCEPLDAEPGSPCGTCGAGAWACSGDNTLACAGDDIDLDTDPVNCGACGNACTGDEICSGGECVEDDGSCPPNACGGCETLPAAPGEACGPSGVWICDGPDALICVE